MAEHFDVLDEKYVDMVLKFVSDLNNGKLDGSCNIALTTVTLLEKIISNAHTASSTELSCVVRAVGHRLARALPQEAVPINMVRRVLRVIRDENLQTGDNTGGIEAVPGGDGGESLQRLVRAAGGGGPELRRAVSDLRTLTLDHIAELKTELEGSAEAVAEQAVEHVHADELILTYGASAHVERFLRRAHKQRPFRLILVQDLDRKQSGAMAARLSTAGVRVTVCGGECAAALMSRVNKVVIGVRGALAGGAVLARAGTAAIAIAANHYAVPVIALAPLYKLSPDQHSQQQALACFSSPSETLGYAAIGSGGVHVYAPRYDYVPPDLVTLFLTNLGGCSPSYIYRLLSELYDPRDYQL